MNFSSLINSRLSTTASRSSLMRNRSVIAWRRTVMASVDFFREPLSFKDFFAMRLLYSPISFSPILEGHDVPKGRGFSHVLVVGRHIGSSILDDLSVHDRLRSRRRQL